MSFEFSLVPDDRLLEAFDVLGAVGKWTQQQGRKQRIAGTGLESYRQWQTEQSNYMVTLEAKIAALVTLRKETLSGWTGHDPGAPIWMVRALATNPEFRGSGVGALALKNLFVIIPDQPLYLDCVSEFLPEYYGQFGFQRVDSQSVPYEDDMLNITLMRREPSNVLEE